MKPSLKEKVCHFYIVDKGTEILIGYIKIYMLQEEMEWNDDKNRIFCLK